NTAEGHGGGLAECEGTIEGNLIGDNGASLDGGGLYRCSTVIRGNRIEGNSVGKRLGGGLFECRGWIADNTIEANDAREGGGAYGCVGALVGNLFIKNVAEAFYISGHFGYGNANGGFGGAVSNHSGTIDQNLFLENSGLGYTPPGTTGDCRSIDFASQRGAKGGAVYQSNGRMTNALFVENFITPPSCRGPDETQEIFLNFNGGAVFEFEGDIVHNTFVSNRALDHGGAISDCSGVIQNNIFWLNSAAGDAQIHNSSLPNHCLIQGWTSGGTGNIDLDPRFVDPENGDFHLRHDSPCIDSGVLIASVTDDYDGNTRPFHWSTQYGGDGSGYDMGAYEFRPTSDVDYDGKVGALDLIVFQYDWGAVSGLGEKIYTPSGMATDMDGNGVVDTRDLLWFLEGIK
ncbi:MAG: hypothetical protein KC917_08040, partial [Candidatus Omnitrophica bacterium]|nr:hypothetical protein [Candidatus Omnitrophota bacterium]